MKRIRYTAAALACALVLGLAASAPAAATAGSAGDPLISRSYLADAFYPELRRAFAAVAEDVAREKLGGDAHPARRVLRLIPGESLSVRAGQEFTLLSGAAELGIAEGTVLNVTRGVEAAGGSVDLRSRYIVCEDASADIDIVAEGLAVASYGVRVGTGSPFTDVRRGAWYYSDVVSAVNRGLVDGVTPSSYAPASTLTVAQCVKLAACMHQLWQEGGVFLEASSAYPWYRPYAAYALEHGILDREPEDYDAVIDRAAFVGMFYRALPAAEYTVRNSVPDGAIPDIPNPAAQAYGEEIYAFYRAGILVGYTAAAGRQANAFGPEDDITRAEVATIMNRMFNPSARQSVTIG